MRMSKHQVVIATWLNCFFFRRW